MDEDSLSSDSLRNVGGRSVSGVSFSIETAARIVVVVILKVGCFGKKRFGI